MKVVLKFAILITSEVATEGVNSKLALSCGDETTQSNVYKFSPITSLCFVRFTWFRSQKTALEKSFPMVYGKVLLRLSDQVLYLHLKVL